MTETLRCPSHSKFRRAPLATMRPPLSQLASIFKTCTDQLDYDWIGDSFRNDAVQRPLNGSFRSAAKRPRWQIIDWRATDRAHASGPLVWWSSADYNVCWDSTRAWWGPPGNHLNIWNPRRTSSWPSIGRRHRWTYTQNDYLLNMPWVTFLIKNVKTQWPSRSMGDMFEEVINFR